MPTPPRSAPAPPVDRAKFLRRGEVAEAIFGDKTRIGAVRGLEERGVLHPIKVRGHKDNLFRPAEVAAVARELALRGTDGARTPAIDARILDLLDRGCAPIAIVRELSVPLSHVERLREELTGGDVARKRESDSRADEKRIDETRRARDAAWAARRARRTAEGE